MPGFISTGLRNSFSRNRPQRTPAIPGEDANAGSIGEKYRFYPIPTAAIATNPQLVQTPAWTGG